MTRPLVIFGSAEIAELALYYFTHDSDYHVAAFTVDDAYVKEDRFRGLPLVPFSEIASAFPPATAAMHVALSYNRLNRLREEKYHQAKRSGYTLSSYVCTKSATWPDLQIGDNCLILENQTIQPTVRIGNNVMLWSGNHIGHGSVIGDHTYLASHIVISGHCHIGQRCFFGVNATVKDFTTIGDDCFVTMDASVTRDLSAGSVALGARGELLDGSDAKAQHIVKKYFHL